MTSLNREMFWQHWAHFPMRGWRKHKLSGQHQPHHVLGDVQGTGDTAVDKSDQNTCSRGVYIPMGHMMDRIGEIK